MLNTLHREVAIKVVAGRANLSTFKLVTNKTATSDIQMAGWLEDAYWNRKNG